MEKLGVQDPKALQRAELDQVEHQLEQLAGGAGEKVAADMDRLRARRDELKAALSSDVTPT